MPSTSPDEQHERRDPHRERILRALVRRQRAEHDDEEDHEAGDREAGTAMPTSSRTPARISIAPIATRIVTG